MLLLPLDKIRPEHAPLIGGKALSIAALARADMDVPDGLVITVHAYHEYLAGSGLRNQIRRELTRRPLDQIRWEEMWDASLRIRNAFLKATMPSRLRRKLVSAVKQKFKGKAVAIRSSAPDEDSSSQSFAGLHESYLNVREPESILEHIQLVWASLWSDGALLYRKELRLDIEQSAMAVLVQEFVLGNRSGVVFGQHPMRPECVAIEAVYGLNQGLVDGTVEPDRWTVDRSTGKILEFRPANRTNYVTPASTGVAVCPLPESKTKHAPLSNNDVLRVHDKAIKVGHAFGAPQDMEWTFKEPCLYLLQSRPITTTNSKEGDKRAWYLSLRRSVENLQDLRGRIENDLIPKMDAEARRWQKVNVRTLSDKALLAELAKRYDRYDKWLSRYWDECIPFAHGIRLFGQFYNDTMQPADAYEFVELLAGGGLMSVMRNNALQRLAAQVRRDSQIRVALEGGDFGKIDKTFLDSLDQFGAEFATGSNVTEQKDGARKVLATLLLQMVEHSTKVTTPTLQRRRYLERAFLAKFRGKKRKEAKELLDLGRASYRLRDDDNIYLGRIARQVEVVKEEAKRRKLKISDRFKGSLALRPTGHQQHAARAPNSAPAAGFTVQARQLTGQPAGPGFAAGKARVIRRHSEELYAFKSGEVLVCDSIDPNMTFVLPLVAAIVECRGGMLVHGAIIAREYGIPCVTGVSNALKMIKSGDMVQVDGYLGIVTID